MDDQLVGLSGGAWNTVYASLVASLNTACVVHMQRATDAGTEANNAAANYQIFFDAYQALGIGQVVFTEPHRTTENALTTDAINATLRSLCAAERIAFFDQKQAVLPSSSTGLGWGDSDNIHRDTTEHRYIAGLFLSTVRDFRSAGSKYPDASSFNSRASEQTFRLAKSARFTPTAINSAGANFSSATFTGTGWANPQVNYRRGFAWTSNASLGDSTGVIGQVSCGDSQWETQNLNIRVVASGDRNMSLPQGAEALLTFGCGDPSDGNAWIKTVSSSAIRCYGVQFANGTDVGLGGTFGTATHLRLWWRDASNVNYSRWVPTLSEPSGAGISIVVEWNKVTGRLSLWSGSNASEILAKTSVAASSLSSNATSFNSIQGTIGARNTDWGNGYGASPTPSSNGRMQWRDITVEYWRP
jgi:hypothetical protein